MLLYYNDLVSRGCRLLLVVDGKCRSSSFVGWGCLQTVLPGSIQIVAIQSKNCGRSCLRDAIPSLTGS